MKIIDKLIPCQSRSEIYEIIPIGDTHIGTRNCAETPLKNLVREIGNNNRAYVIFGGDLHDAITPQDIGRFDFESLPDWMVEGDALNTREKLNDIITQQADRVCKIFDPIPRERIIGAVLGNHEFSILKYSGRALHKSFCKKMNIADLDDEALIRLRFKRVNHVTTIIIYIRHGYGGGRTPGAEPN